jgi:hypothetical protein
VREGREVGREVGIERGEGDEGEKVRECCGGGDITVRECVGENGGACVCIKEEEKEVVRALHTVYGYPPLGQLVLASL